MFQELLQEILKYLLLFLVIYTFVTYLISPVRTFGNVHSRWHKTFSLQFSTQEIYESITEAIKGTGIDRTEIAIVQHSSNTSFFSANRLYLQVRRGDQMFLICAAPFGSGFFVSWWMGEPLNYIKDLIPRIPKIGPAIAIWMYRKTFFMMDTDDMFKDCVRECINGVLDKITSEKGIRPMSDVEREPVSIPLKDRFS